MNAFSVIVAMGTIGFVAAKVCSVLPTAVGVIAGPAMIIAGFSWICGVAKHNKPDHYPDLTKRTDKTTNDWYNEKFSDDD
jgi:hypothetical protein